MTTAKRVKLTPSLKHANIGAFFLYILLWNVTLCVLISLNYYSVDQDSVFFENSTSSSVLFYEISITYIYPMKLFYSLLFSLFLSFFILYKLFPGRFIATDDFFIVLQKNSVSYSYFLFCCGLYCVLVCLI